MLACKLIPMIRCELSETEKLQKAGMCLDLADGGHYAMACIISPIMQHAQSDSELINNAGCQPSLIRLVTLRLPDGPLYSVNTLASSPTFAIATASKMDSPAAPRTASVARCS
jgi:hypothetical protein